MLLAACTCLASRALAAGEAQITAVLSPQQIAVGQAARLTVTLSNAQGATAPQLPAIDGLMIQGTGQSTNIQIVNGRVTSQLTHTFFIQGVKPGDYTIPPLSVELGGQTLRSSPLSLRVAATADAAGAGRGTRPQPGASPGVGAEPPALAVLEIDLPPRDLYVGEVVPATFRLLVREGARVTEVSAPTIGSNAFTVTRPKDEQPQQSETVIDGTRYLVLSFPVALGAVAAGEQSIEPRMEFAAILPSNDRRRRGIFDDPFFDAFMGGTQQRKLTAKGKPVATKVLSLPDEGRPSDFSGGIGHFTLAATATPANVAVGDPVSLTVTLSGRGNFDRVAVPPLASDADWKTYPTSSKFEPSDALALAGKKVFEQAIIPQRPDLGGVPPRTLSYFDPEAKRYVKLSTERIALAIAQAPRAGAQAKAGSTSAGAGSGAASSAERAASDGASGFELAPNQIALGELRGPRAPLARRPDFLAAQLAPVLGAGLAILWLRRRDRLARDPAALRLRAAERAVDEQLEVMRRAAAAHDGAAFFAAARRAVQECVAARSNRSATALTAAGIEETITAARGGGAAATAAHAALVARVREVFAVADAATYSGQQSGEAELAEWRQKVEALLAELRGAR